MLRFGKEKEMFFCHGAIKNRPAPKHTKYFDQIKKILNYCKFKINTCAATFFLPGTILRNLQILTCLNEWILWNFGGEIFSTEEDEKGY